MNIKFDMEESKQVNIVMLSLCLPIILVMFGYSVYRFESRVDYAGIVICGGFAIACIYGIRRSLNYNQKLFMRNDECEFVVGDLHKVVPYSEIAALECKNYAMYYYNIRTKDGFQFRVIRDLFVEEETIPEDYKELYDKSYGPEGFTSFNFIKAIFKLKTGLVVNEID